MENSDKFVSFEDEILKMIAYYDRCAKLRHNGEHFVNVVGVVLKLKMLLCKSPLVLCESTNDYFLKLKSAREEYFKGFPEEKPNE